MSLSQVQDIMSRSVVVIDHFAKVGEAFRLMRLHNIRHVAVLDDDEELVGILSDRDLLRSFLGDDARGLVAEEQGAYLGDDPVADFMTKDPETVEGDCSIATACSIMMENRFDCVPVVYGRKLIGIVTSVDVFRYVVMASENAEIDQNSAVL